jgi:uncharacterized protein GlcG (DUF336 family)
MRIKRVRRIVIGTLCVLGLLAVSLKGYHGPGGKWRLPVVEAQGGTSLSSAEITQILNQAEARANGTVSGLRNLTGQSNRTTKMHIAVVDRQGRILGIRSMNDAWEASLDIAVAKARTAAFLSSNENALTSRVVGQLSQAHNQQGTGPAQPLWGVWETNKPSDLAGSDRRNGLVVFPGGIPLYKGNVLVGGIGVSGDGVDQDEAVALAGEEGGFAPGTGVAKLGLP